MTPRPAKTNLDAVEDVAARFGMAEMGEARFLRTALGAERIGLADYRVKPGRRAGFGHRHREAEELYVVLAGSGRFKLDNEIIDVTARDVLYCPPSVMREWEAGPDGLHMLAFGGHADNDNEGNQEFWVD
jgi:uncharacterized cupin superfamily protein